MGLFSTIGKVAGGIGGVVLGGPLGGILGSGLGGALGGIVDGLLNVERSSIDDILTELNQQVDIVREEVFNPLQDIVQQIAEGQVFRGAAADAFVEQVSALHIPAIGQIGEGIEAMHKNLQFAADTIDNADDEVEQLISNGLRPIFEAIY